MLENLLPMLNDLVVIFFDLLIFTRMVSLRRDTVLTRLAMYLGCGAIIVSYLVAAYRLNYPPIISSALCMSIPSLLLFFALSRYRDSRLLLTFCFVDSLSLIVAFIGRYVGIVTGKTGGLLALVVTTLLFLAIVAVGWKAFARYHDLLALTEEGWSLMALTSFLIYFGLIFFATYPKPMIQRMEYMPSYLVFSIIALSCYAVFTSSVLKTKKICEQNIRLAHEAEIHRVAYTDALTGLANRAAYIERVNDLEREKEKGQSVCCVMLDVNQFKGINDNRGHHVGDQALCAVTNALRQVFARQEERIFRIGGDEFAVILLDTPEETVREKLSALQQELKREGDGLGVSLSAAVGYSFLRLDQNDTVERAFIRADHRMYQNKNSDAAAL